MYVCIGIRPRIECPDYEVVGLQPQTAYIPDLDLVFPLSLFKPNNEVWEETISTECELYMTWIQHTDTNKGYTCVVTNSSRFGDDVASLATGRMRSAWTEHPENWPLPGSEKRYCVCALTGDSSPSERFSGFRECRFKPRTRPYIDIEIAGQTLSTCWENKY